MTPMQVVVIMSLAGTTLFARRVLPSQGLPASHSQTLMGVSVPDRIIRDELLESDRWLDLARNTHRLAYVVLLLCCDALGNMEAGQARIARLFRTTCGGCTNGQAAEALTALADADLIRLYETDGKRYLHIPRFRQRLRYLRHVAPLSPWTTNEQKQQLTQNSPDSHLTVTGCTPDSHRPEVEVEIEKKQVSTSKARSKTTRESASPPAPEWLPPDVWQKWREHRKAMRAPMTLHAEHLAIQTLSKLRDMGHDPVSVIAVSIERGWKGLFELKNSGDKNGRQERRATTLDELTGGLAGRKRGRVIDN